MQMEKLILGGGDSCFRGGKARQAQRNTAPALTRCREADLEALGIQPMRGDVRELLDVIALPPVETILYAVAPGRNEEQTPDDVWIGGLGNIKGAISDWRHQPRLIFISSTSVYGQT